MNRDKIVSTRITSEEFEFLEIWAKNSDVNMSDLLRDLINNVRLGKYPYTYNFQYPLVSGVTSTTSAILLREVC